MNLDFSDDQKFLQSEAKKFLEKEESVKRSQISFGPILVSGLNQLITMQVKVAQKAAFPGDRPNSISTVMTTSGKEKYQPSRKT